MVTNGALEAISGLTLTSANHDEVIEILKRRFGNKQLIINQHMEQLLSVEGVTSQHDVKGLRHLYYVIESNVRSLRSLDVSADSYGSLLSSVLMNKLPPELRSIATRKFGGTDSWDFSVLLKVIQEEVQVREQSSVCKTQECRRPWELPTGAALLVNTPLQCCFCQQEHSSQDCKVVVGVEARREKLRRSGRCYICLARGHVSRNCRSRFKCLSSKGRHHIAICPEMLQSKANTSCKSSPASNSSPNASTLNPNAQDYQPASTHTMWTYSGKHVLLQTARATAFNPNDPSKTCSVRIVMDTGSRRSYIADRVGEMLALASVREQCMIIMTFGASEGTNCVCGCVEVGIKLRKGCSQLLTIFTIPTICEPPTPHSLASCRELYPHLRGMK